MGGLIGDLIVGHLTILQLGLPLGLLVTGALAQVSKTTY